MLRYFRLASLLVTIATAATAATAKAPVWETLALTDCNGGMSFLPTSPVAIHGDGSQAANLVSVLVDELLDRAQCDTSASKINQEDILERFVPSLNMAMSNLFGYESAPTGNGGGSRQSFYNAANPLFRAIGKNIRPSILGMVPSFGINLKELFKDVQCDPASYKAGQPCRMKVDMKNVLGFDIGITAQKCDKTNPLHAHKHFSSLNCIGEMCGYLMKPCTDTSDCGDSGHCKMIELDANGIIDVAAAIGLMNKESDQGKFKSTAADIKQCIEDATTATMSYGWRVMMGLTKWMDGYFGNGIASSAPKFGICLPKGVGEDNNNVFEDLGNGFSTWIKRFDASSQKFDTHSKVVACKSKGCNIDNVGDSICDPDCNNEACAYDGNDCKGSSKFTANRNAAADANHQKFILTRNEAPTTNEDEDNKDEEDNNDEEWMTKYTKKTYASIDVSSGKCVTAYTDSSKKGGPTNFYGATTITSTDVCSSKSQSVCGTANDGCVFVPLRTCQANAANESYCGDSFVKEHPTNTAKTKMYTSTKDDTCGKHRMANPMCGDGRCDVVYTANCVVPFCQPNGDSPGQGKHTEQGSWFVEQISEKQTCAKDCGPTQGCDSDTTVVLGVDASKKETFVYEEIVPTAKGVFLPWDGALAAKGDYSNSANRKFGREFPAPTSDLFATGNGAMAFLRHTCDGKLGFNLGNGLYLALHIPSLPDFVQKFSNIVENIQTCRHAMNGVTELTKAEFRNKWSLWTLDPFFQRLTSKPKTAAQQDYTVNPWTFMNDLNNPESKLSLPSSCTHTTWSTEGECKLKFTGLKKLLSSTVPEDLYVEVKRCAAPMDGALPAFSIVVDGAQLTVSNPIQDCNTATDCKKGLACVDVNKEAKLEDIFKNTMLTYTPEGKSAEEESTSVYNFPLMSDPISALLYGTANGRIESCSSKDWYGKGTQKAARHLMRKCNNGPSDGGTSLKLCLPPLVNDIEAALNGARRFIPEVLCGPDDKSKACVEAQNDPLMKNVNGIITIRGLEKTDRSATRYQLMSQYSQREDGKWNMKAELGKKWLPTKIKISEKFKNSACTQTNAIRTSIITKLKKDNYDLWQDLAPRHVLVQCTGFDANLGVKKIGTKRRLQHHRRFLAEQELQINIQVPDDKQELAIQATKNSIGDSESIATTLAEAGVTDEAGKTITVDAVSEVDVSDTTTDEIVVENLPPDVASAMGNEAETTADTTGNQDNSLVLVVICIVVGGLCCCGLFIAGGVFSFKKKKEQRNQVQGNVINVIELKQQPAQIVEAEVMAVPVPVQ